MDFHSLSRKELQALCKKNKIPANITNLAMADALAAALPQVEGLDEYLNPTEGDCGSGTPDTHHRTATRRKGIKDESESSKVSSRVQRGSRAKNVEFVQDSNVNVLPVTPAVMPPTSRRRALPVSTRRKKEEEEDDDDDDDDKNEVLLQTPAALPSSRSRATGRTPRGGTTSYSTRRSVRLLEKNLSKMTLLDSEDMGPHHAVSEQELSNVSHQTQHSVETQKVNDAGASLQTVSTVVSEETDELEVSSLEKNTEYEECQSEIQLVSGAENDVVAGLQADPQEEDVENLNCLEAEPRDSNLKLEGISETCDDSNEVGECSDDLVVDLKKSVPIGEAVQNEAGSGLSSELEDFSEPENKDCLGTKQEVLSAEVSEDAFMEFTEQDVADLSVEVPGDASLEVADQCVAGSVPMSSASVDSVNLKELVEWNTDNQDNNNEDDDNKDKNNKTADGNYIPNFEPVFAGDEKAADEKDLASREGVLEKVDNASDVNRASFTVFALEKDASFEKAEDLYGSSEKLEAKAQPEDSEEHTFDVSGASAAILGADMDANFENSTTVSEFCFESSADKSIMDAENVTVESSLLDVGVHKAEDLKDNSEILESKAQAEESEQDAAAEETALDASVLGGISNPQFPQQISVESTGNSIDSSSDALMSVLSCNSNPLVDCDVISEEIAIPKQESSVLAETEAVAPIHEQKISDIPIQSIVADQLKGESLFPVHSETEGFANEIQTVPQLINTEDNMHNVNMMKENLTTDELDKKSMAELKKMLKKLTLDGKSNCKSKTNDVVKEVEKRRTALQALPENRMTSREAHTDG